MLMFTFHIAQALSLMALGLGVGFIVWAGRNQGSGAGALKFFGYIIAILSVLNIACNSYTSYKYWQKGYYEMPMMMKMMGNQMPDNMHNNMQNNM
jgi:hypothetical protein